MSLTVVMSYSTVADSHHVIHDMIKRQPRTRTQKARTSAKHVSVTGHSVHRDSDLYRAIVESAEQYGIIAFDLDGQIRLWNSGAAHLFGTTREEMIGKDAESIFIAEDRSRGIPMEEIRTALLEGHAADERWHMRKDGSRFWADGLLMPLKEDIGQMQGFVKIMRDKSDSHTLNEKLQDLETRMNEEGLGGFARDIHELRCRYLGEKI